MKQPVQWDQWGPLKTELGGGVPGHEDWRSASQ